MCMCVELCPSLQFDYIVQHAYFYANTKLFLFYMALWGGHISSSSFIIKHHVSTSDIFLKYFHIKLKINFLISVKNSVGSDEDPIKTIDCFW